MYFSTTNILTILNVLGNKYNNRNKKKVSKKDCKIKLGKFPRKKNKMSGK